jgi:hypothetical protein
MSEIVPAPPAPVAPATDINVPEPNPAIARCRQAYRQAAKAAREQRKYDFEIKSAAEEAYRNAMPPLSGIENIRDFIACVAQGMLNGSISGPEGARLLYAAQVASGAQGKPIPGKPGRPPAQPLPNN